MSAADAMMALLQRARGGERAAFDSLCRTLQPRLRARLEGALGVELRGKIDVEDLEQETFLRAWRSLGGFSCGDADAFLAWLGGIARHVILEEARRRRPEPISGDAGAADGGPSPSRAAQREERMARLEASLAGLSEDHREVIRLARLERLPMKEVAARMGRSTEAATQLLWRALKKLRESFGSTDSFHLPPRPLRPANEEERR
jgi:RNA polymerase sigma-70 factor (ECF subfamily)